MCDVHPSQILCELRNKYLKDGVLEQKKGELKLIHVKNMKISYKTIFYKDSFQKYEDLIQKYLV
ncbi:hypothetical protein MTR_2g060950 [Medicago truncatula]|nr:hypothetical protein MTR_2g060950 [Medicago truncatula]